MAGPRQVNPADLQMQFGVLIQRTARNAKGRYVDADNVRWFQGLPQKLGGWQEEPLVDEDGNTVLYEGRARTYLDWDSLDGQNWVAIGTHRKLYVLNNGRLYDITPLRKSSSLNNAFTTMAGSDVILVYDPEHDAGPGDAVRFKQTSPVGGVLIDGEYEILDTVDLDRYLIRHTVTPSSSVTGGGTGVAEYDISVGLESDDTLDGYGTGDFGVEDYGTPRSSSNFGGLARVWSLDNWGEDLLAVPNGGTLYWWDKTSGPNSRAQVVANAPANIEFMLVGPDDRHVIAFGTNTVTTGQQDKMFIRWCAGDDFNTWLASETNDAGSKRLDTGSRLIGAVKTRGLILTFTDKQIYSGTSVGGSDVYSFLPLGGSRPLASPNAAVDVDGVVHGMTDANFFIFDGTMQTIPCEIYDYVFGSLNKAMLSKVTCRYVRAFDEVRFSFASQDMQENDRVAIYNRTHNCWYPSSISEECGGDTNRYYGVPIAFRDQAMYRNETGTGRDLNDPMVSYLRTYDSEINGGAWEMLLHQMIPDFKDLEGAMEVTVFGRDAPANSGEDASVTLTVDATTEVIEPEFRMRRMGFYFESDELGDFWRMDTWQILVGPYGRR